jgi:GTP cyclohydrolase I
MNRQTLEDSSNNPATHAKQTELNVLASCLLKTIGEKPGREGLRDTPKRFAKAISFLTSGYAKKSEDLVGDAVFEEKAGELVLIKDIEFFSLCEHHILPFFGKAHVAYIPDGRIIGLSKVPRIVDMFARRLQVQERLTRQIAEELNRLLKPKGVAVFIEASHLCMMMRGVEKQSSTTVTKTVLGDFVGDANLRTELLSLIQR